MSNLTYVSPCETRPNRDREVKVDNFNLRLWALEFELKGGKKGCAVIKASNSNNAIRILLSDGMYNGTPTIYQVTKVEEINESLDSMLICEQIND